jgi:hypothetical protein
MKNRILWLGWVIAGAALLYMGLQFYLRDAVVPVATRTPKFDVGVERFGGTALKVLGFYATPAIVYRGEPATVCYGVVNAREVKLDPPVADVWPAFNRCFEVTPQQETTYTLTVTGKDGTTQMASFTLAVGAGRLELPLFATSERKIKRGEPVTFMYKTKNATRVILEPGKIPLPTDMSRMGYRFFPPATTEYTLVVEGGDDQVIRHKFKVTVK